MMPWDSPCDCGVSHEHSDFEPHACIHCPCAGHRPPGTRAHTATPTQTGPRQPVTADKPDFARQRVTQTAQWLDWILLLKTADDPASICQLADHLEQHWPAHLDIHDALALAITRLTTQKPTLKRRALRLTRRAAQ